MWRRELGRSLVGISRKILEGCDCSVRGVWGILPFSFICLGFGFVLRFMNAVYFAPVQRWEEYVTVITDSAIGGKKINDLPKELFGLILKITHALLR